MRNLLLSLCTFSTIDSHENLRNCTYIYHIHSERIIIKIFQDRATAMVLIKLLRNGFSKT